MAADNYTAAFALARQIEARLDVSENGAEIDALMAAGDTLGGWSIYGCERDLRSAIDNDDFDPAGTVREFMAAARVALAITGTALAEAA